MQNELIIILKLILAIILGGLVGWEREHGKKPAGLRTHMLVCLGSALVTIVSLYVFERFGSATDPGRIAAGIVTGIGFLGAGAIIRLGGSVKGLTTAASIWMVAAIGLAVGCGLYLTAIISAILCLVILFGLMKLEEYFQKSEKGKKKK